MLKHVRITGYKSLSDVSVALEPVTVLIGRSGSGKTNFVEALRFLRDYLLARGPAVVSSYGGWGRVFSATMTSPHRLSFAVRFTAPGVSEEYEYSLTLGQRDGNPRDEGPSQF